MVSFPVCWSGGWCTGKKRSGMVSEAHCWIGISHEPEQDIPAVKALCEALDLSFTNMYLFDWEWKISESLFLWFWKMRMEKFHSRDNLFYHIWYMWSKTMFSVFVSRKQKLFFFFILAIFARIFSFHDPIFCLSNHIFWLC